MPSGLRRVFDALCTRAVLSCDFLVHMRKVMKGKYAESIDGCFSIGYIDSRLRRATSRLSDGYVCDTFKYSLRVNSIEYEPSVLRLLQAAHLIQFAGTYSDICFGCQLIRTVSKKTKYLRSKFHNLPKTFDSDVETSHMCYLTALDVMENLTGSSGHLEFQVVSEISKVLLSLASKCKDSKSNALAKANLSYLAALHFSASEYEIVIDRCTRVIMNEKFDDDDEETLNASCLLYIETISNTVGLYLIFIKIKAALHYTRRQFFLDLRLTPEVFAQYLRISTTERIDGVVEHFSIYQNPKFPLDAILTAIMSRRCSLVSKKRKSVLCVYNRTDCSNTLTKRNESSYVFEDQFIHWLIELSLENMTSFYNALS